MKRRTKIAVGAAVAIAIAGGGAAFARHRIKQRDAERRADEASHLAQDFAEVGQCFFGGQPRTDEIGFRKMMNISSRLGGTPSRYPFDCRERVDRFRTRVETAHYLEKEGAVRLSSALFKVDQYLAEGDVQMVQLADYLTVVWTLASTSGIAAGTPQTPGPPIPRELAVGAARLPVRGLVPLDGGPSWQFLGWDEKGLLQCGGDAKLVCKRVDIGDSTVDRARQLTSRGSWSSPRFILLESTDGLWLLADGKLEALPLKPRSSVSAHVGANGELRVLERGTPKKLWLRPAGGAATTVDLKDALAEIDRPASRDLKDALLLGPNLLVLRASGDLFRYPLEVDGKLGNGVKLDVGLRENVWDMELRTCRAGPQDVVLLPGKMVFDTPDGLATIAERGDRCSASGVVWTALRGCTPAGCTDRPEAVFDREGAERNLSPYETERDRVGTGQAIAWVARMGGGLLIRGNASDVTTTVAVADADLAPIAGDTMVDLLNRGVGGPTRSFGVYGGPSGGVALYRDEKGPQVGVAISAAGEVLPLTMEGL